MGIVEVAVAIALGLVLTVIVFTFLLAVISELIYLAWRYKQKKRARYDG